MYAFINNIKVQVHTLYEHSDRALTKEEKDQIIPLFKRKSKRTFPFEDIAKKPPAPGEVLDALPPY